MMARSMQASCAGSESTNNNGQKIGESRAIDTSRALGMDRHTQTRSTEAGLSIDQQRLETAS